mgnify:CR=1 FL=1
MKLRYYRKAPPEPILQSYNYIYKLGRGYRFEWVDFPYQQLGYTYEQVSGWIEEQSEQYRWKDE